MKRHFAADDGIFKTTHKELLCNDHPPDLDPVRVRESGLSSSTVFRRQRRSRSRRNTVGRIGGGGLIVQCTMDATMVVIQLPAVNHPACFFHAQEQFSIQELGTELAIKGLGVAVLPGTSFGNEQQPNIRTPQPIANDGGNELGAIVTTDMLRSASNRKKKRLHAMTCSRPVWRRRESNPRPVDS